MPVTVQPEPQLRSTGCEPGHSAASASTDDGQVASGPGLPPSAPTGSSRARDRCSSSSSVAAPPSPASAGGLFVVLGWWAWHVLELLAELVTAGE
jgi:hypothetical protein